MTATLDGEKATYRGHRERHDRQPAALARSAAGSGGGTRPVPSSAGSARRIAVPPGEARGPEGVPPPTDRPATAAARTGQRRDGPAARRPQDEAGGARPAGDALGRPTAELTALGRRHAGPPQARAPPPPAPHHPAAHRPAP